MGPCFMSTEDINSELLLLMLNPASMGPCFMSTEDAGSAASPQMGHLGFNGAVLHEHGRPHSVGVSRRTPPCFNGAVLHEHGRLRG